MSLTSLSSSEKKAPSQFWEVDLLGSASGEQLNNAMSYTQQRFAELRMIGKPYTGMQASFPPFSFFFEVVGWVVNNPDPCSTLDSVGKSPSD